MRRRDSIAYVILEPLLVWAALMLVLAVSILYAFLGAPFPLPVNLTIAAAMAVVIGVIFMRLISESPLIRLAAGGALIWLVFMFSLSFADYVMRRPGGIPRCQALGQPCAQQLPASAAR